MGDALALQRELSAALATIERLVAGNRLLKDQLKRYRQKLRREQADHLQTAQRLEVLRAELSRLRDGYAQKPMHGDVAGA